MEDEVKPVAEVVPTSVDLDGPQARYLSTFAQLEERSRTVRSLADHVATLGGVGAALAGSQIASDTINSRYKSVFAQVQERSRVVQSLADHVSTLGGLGEALAKPIAAANAFSAKYQSIVDQMEARDKKFQSIFDSVGKLGQMASALTAPIDAANVFSAKYQSVIEQMEARDKKFQSIFDHASKALASQQGPLIFSALPIADRHLTQELPPSRPVEFGPIWDMLDSISRGADLTEILPGPFDQLDRSDLDETIYQPQLISSIARGGECTAFQSLEILQVPFERSGPIYIVYCSKDQVGWAISAIGALIGIIISLYFGLRTH